MASTDFKDYYAILGVSKTASAAEIKKKFRKLALQYHPDRNPGDKQAEARFKEINEAYEVLSDSDKRSKYDQFGKYWQQAGQTNWPGGGGVGVGNDFSNFDFGRYNSFDEFINELLGRFTTPGAGGYSNYRSGGTGNYSDFGFNNFGNAASNVSNQATAADREATISLSFTDAFYGVKKQLSLGSETVSVKIPPGTKSGSRVRLRGKGHYNSYNQQRGDLYLIIELQPHPFFQFEDDNLVCEVPITPDEAVLGASIEVPTPDGMVTMLVPAGIRSGQTLRLRGKGWVNPKGGRGDQLVKIAIATPKSISSQEREYYEKIRDSRSYNPRNGLERNVL